MHERRTKSGHRSLVVVRRTTGAIRGSIDLPDSYAVWIVDATKWGVKLTSAVETLPPALYMQPGMRIKFFAGQCDRNDESHFTIRYEADGRPGIIDGILNDGHSTDPMERRVDLEDRGLIGAGGR